MEREMFSYPPIEEEILALLRNREEFVVIGHVSPDGDCLSSQMAMNSMLLKMGKQFIWRMLVHSIALKFPISALIS